MWVIGGSLDVEVAKVVVAGIVILVVDFVMVARLGKAGSMGSAEPDFFQILCQICPFFATFLPNFTTAYQNLPKFTKVYQIYQILPNCYHSVPNFTNF